MLSTLTLLCSVIFFFLTHFVVPTSQDDSSLLQLAMCLYRSKLWYLLSLLHRMDVILPFLFLLHPVDLYFCFKTQLKPEQEFSFFPTSMALCCTHLFLLITQYYYCDYQYMYFPTSLGSLRAEIMPEGSSLCPLDRP